uniref:Uncharacterized protein n=1 Tax=Eutreptiella gymnastica TaxID=73025 RepID=A0A7S1I0I2_9EUGL|mmetsp:Transcript_11921/g.21643  ORF Transcript_11921/g.21643 Transcript_11921/m.21643 type:complete len:135 (+) Transcript_11921:2109-2513(+)
MWPNIGSVGTCISGGATCTPIPIIQTIQRIGQQASYSIDIHYIYTDQAASISSRWSASPWLPSVHVRTGPGQLACQYRSLNIGASQGWTVIWVQHTAKFHHMDRQALKVDYGQYQSNIVPTPQISAPCPHNNLS